MPRARMSRVHPVHPRPTTHQVPYGTRTLTYSLHRSARTTLAIEVHPDLSIHVIAPEGTPLATIGERLLARGPWLLRQFRYFEQFLPVVPPREFVSGESHYYLGRRYTLRVRRGQQPSVKLIGGELTVTTPAPGDPGKVRALLTAWYHAHASRVFHERMDAALARFTKYKLQAPEWRIQRMPKRWGSCTPKGTILLNPDLITKPASCIDYVIVHELCHLIHPYHDKAFYTLQARVMPDGSRWKQRLERTG